MSREESRTIRGGLTPAQVQRLSPEVRAARAAYLSDSAAQLDSLFEAGVTELRSDDPDKDHWSGEPRNRVESLDNLLEIGYQIDNDANLYDPEAERGRGKRRAAD